MWCIYHDIVALEKPFHFGQFWLPFHGKCKDNWNKDSVSVSFTASGTFEREAI